MGIDVNDYLEFVWTEKGTFLVRPLKGDAKKIESAQATQKV
jgi:hypothetical protein